jgi:N-acetylglucosamine repressor
MTRKKTGNNKYLKELNQKVLLDLVRIHGAVSKAELAEWTGLTPTAVGVISGSLLEMGYLHETGTGESKGGRRPVLLELRSESFYSIGVDIDVRTITAVLMDIKGSTVREELVEFPEGADFETAGGIIVDMVGQLTKQAAISPERLLGVGISIPGMVDSETRSVVLAPNLGWRDADLQTWLSRHFTVPVYVENEAMASAICENWIGSCQGINDFVCINIKSGIGAGIFTGGKLYRGAGGSAGEVGHIVVDENGPRCGCGNYGCLETMASTAYVVEKARKLVRQGIVSSLNTYEDTDKIGMEEIIREARKGDEASRGILNEAARYIGIAISNIVNTLNPSRIVIGREFVQYGDLVMEQVKNVVSGKALKAPASRVEILASDIGEKASMLGAAIIPLKVLFGR